MQPAKFGGFLLVNLLVCIWIGYLLDSWTHMSPIWVIVLTLYAVIGSFILLIWSNKKKQKEKDKQQ